MKRIVADVRWVLGWALLHWDLARAMRGRR
jgi:hypothetical protein